MAIFLDFENVQREKKEFTGLYSHLSVYEFVCRELKHLCAINLIEDDDSFCLIVFVCLTLSLSLA